MSKPDALALLDLEHGEGFGVSGEAYDLVAAADMPYEEIVLALQDPMYFVRRVAGGVSMPMRAVRPLRDAWAVRSGLPVDPERLRRLLWVVSTFHEALELDLLDRGLDLGALWRARRWRLLLNIIEHLPRSSHMHEAMSNDEEYAAAVAQQIVGQKASGDEPPAWSPPMHEFTPDVAMLASVLDAINDVRFTLVAVNSAKGQTPQPSPRTPRPESLLTKTVRRAEETVRWRQHESLANRVLARRRKTE